jgi:hypothetical protein
MSTENDQAEAEDVELVVASDGVTYRVLKGPYTPLPPLPITEIEQQAVDGAIWAMVDRFRWEQVKVERPRFVNEEKEACVVIDKIVADEMWSLREKVPEDTVEKLFQRLDKVSPKSDEDALAVGVLFIRFWDIMEAMVSYRRKYRGKSRDHCKYTKEEAHEILRQRGLTCQ